MSVTLLMNNDENCKCTAVEGQVVRKLLVKLCEKQTELYEENQNSRKVNSIDAEL